MMSHDEEMALREKAEAAIRDAIERYRRVQPAATRIALVPTTLVEAIAVAVVDSLFDLREDE